jgi:hypothetical protein
MTITLFNVLDEIGKKNYDIPSVLTEDEMKKFHPFVLLQWMKGSKGISYDRLQAVNKGFFSLPSSVQMTLLATVSPKPGRYRWQWSGKKKEGDESGAQIVDAIQSLYDLDRSTARSVVELFSEEEQAELIEQYGDSSGTGTSKKTKGTRLARK